MKKLKILLWDIETSPNEGYIWGKYEQNVIEFTKEWELLSFAYKFVGDKKVKCKARADFKDKSDKSLVKELHTLINSADISIAHNGNQFDIKKANARFIFHGLPPPKTPTTIDTKLVAKRYFNFNSNSLNDLGQYLGLGKKESTGGFSLWKDCMAGKAKAWKLMKKYNSQDVVLLEKVYEKFKPWITNHPNIAKLQYNKSTEGCPNCGSFEIYSNGIRATTSSLMQRMRCRSCGANHQVSIKKKT